MSHAINAPLSFDGQAIATPAGAAVVAVQRINAAMFGLSVRDGATGAEVDDLSRSYPAERQARHAARVAVTLFRSGWTVEQVRDLVAVFAGTPDPAGSARAANRRRGQAEFAEATCDPDGPGAPQPGDTIRVVYGEAEGERFTVASAEPRRREGGWTEFTVTGHPSGRPLTLTLGQVAIESRPANLAATAADDETHDTDDA